MASLVETSPHLIELLEQSKSKGATIGNVDFIYTPFQGHGIFAKTDIESNDIILRIPYNICLSVDNIINCEALKQIFEDNLGLISYPDEILAIGIMYAALEIKKGNNQSCAWLIHVQTFPESFNTPLFWTESELDELRGCTVFHLTKLLSNQMEADWTNIHQPLSEQYPDLLGGSSLELYRWALSAVYSRAVGIYRRNKYVRVIPPVLDMANHSCDAGIEPLQSIDFMEPTDEILLRSHSKFSEGDEIHVMYGQYPNAKLLYTYGFVIPECSHKAIDLWSRVQPTIYGYDQKIQLLQSHPLTAVEQTYNFQGTIRTNWVSPTLLATIRVIQATEDEMDPDILSNAVNGKILSVRNEAATYTALKNLIIAKMNVHHAESDRNLLGNLLLSGTPADDRKLMALIVRVEERELLQDTLSMIAGWSAALEAQQEAYQPPDAPLPLEVEEEEEETSII